MSNLRIRTLVDNFVSQLDGEIRAAALEAVRAALGSAASLPKAAAPAVKAAAAQAKPAKRGRPPKAKPAAAAAQAAAPKGAAPVKTILDLIPSKKPGAKPAAAPKATGTRNRRSAADLDRDVAKVVGYVKSNPGTSNEKARAALKMEREVWKITVKRAIDTKQIARKGERRESTLHLG